MCIRYGLNFFIVLIFVARKEEKEFNLIVSDLVVCQRVALYLLICVEVA